MPGTGPITAPAIQALLLSLLGVAGGLVVELEGEVGDGVRVIAIVEIPTCRVQIRDLKHN